eukprot:TRINITY_DN91174_c0_g1_i1.p1 TRINITY_DN91174_c0_g1~~TRINITY_DN91174_c0_g1_i1.p1  ORF type:complete len:455 (-),score=38.64 TRINITY_DN91174_c0_g1_i1:79-1443(-)
MFGTACAVVLLLACGPCFRRLCQRARTDSARRVSLNAFYASGVLAYVGVILFASTYSYHVMDLGANGLKLSLATTAAITAGDLIGEVVLGSLSDILGRRAQLLLICYCVDTIFYLLIPLAPFRALPALIALRFFQGTFGSTQAVENAFLTDGLTSELRDQSLMKNQIAQGVGSVAGGLVALSTAGKIGFETCCEIVSCFFLLSALLAFMFYADSTGSPGAALCTAHHHEVAQADMVAGRKQSHFWSVLTSPTLMTLVLMFAVNEFGCGFTDGIDSLFYKHHFHFSQTDFTYLLTIKTLVPIFVYPFVPWLIHRVGDAELCCILSLGASFCTMSVFLAQTWTTVIIKDVIGIGICKGSVTIISLSAVTARCPSEHRGTMFGLCGLATKGSVLIAAPVGGLIYDQNPFSNFVILSVSFVVNAVAWTSFSDQGARRKATVGGLVCLGLLGLACWARA